MELLWHCHTAGEQWAVGLFLCTATLHVEQWAVELHLHTATLLGSSGQWNS